MSSCAVNCAGLVRGKCPKCQGLACVNPALLTTLSREEYELRCYLYLQSLTEYALWRMFNHLEMHSISSITAALSHAQEHSEFCHALLPERENNALISQESAENAHHFGPVETAGIPYLIALSAQVWRKKHPQARLWVLSDIPRLRPELQGSTSLWGVWAHLLLENTPAVKQSDLEDPEMLAQTHHTLSYLSKPAKKAEAVFLSPKTLTQACPSPDDLGETATTLAVGEEHDPEKLEASLIEAGFEKVAHIHNRGQYAVRGGIVDIFTCQEPLPVRIEFFDTEIESIREFDLDTQTSTKKLKSVSLTLTDAEEDAQISDYIGEHDLIISIGEDAFDLPVSQNAHLHFSPNAPLLESGEADHTYAIHSRPLGAFEAGDFVLQESRRHSFIKQIAEWKKDDWKVHLLFSNKGEIERFEELVSADLFPAVELSIADLPHSFTIPALKLAVLSSAEIFGRYQTTPAKRQTAQQHQQRACAQTQIHDINEGDLVVHSEYGIGRFMAIDIDPDGYEEINIRYRDGAILSVPIDQAHLLARYVGMGGKEPILNKLGDAKWTRTRKSAEKSILDYAAQLLRMQAERHTVKSEGHPPDTKWMWEFENSFHFTETPDQLTAIEDTKADMESTKPMDRLICGDVGFGKTEVAIRAAFKAVTGGKQAAILVPTTVLAEQHWRTFRERMSDYPIRVDLLNRFRKPAEVRATLSGLADGSVDIVIGTHRLVSDDVVYKDLGVAIVDEEQRFGVKHKEKFKHLFRNIDILTLSATPIPRTLYLSLMGTRDMSTIDTAPPNKVPVQTTISGYDERTIRSAIEREMARGGQIFFLHNRVKTIDLMKKKILDLVPDAKVLIGHGQMDKDELEVVMRKFVNGEADILLATTIIESGIDIPNANTIIIDRADRFGLADLYQLRGRVGRGGQNAYAILLLPKDLVSGDARRRINAIKQYTALGSGFKIAMRDLEIRGAGNLLGTKQSGHIAAVGFDLYCQLLRQSIDRLRGNLTTRRIDVTLRADILSFNEGEFLQSDPGENLPAYIPATYMTEATMRIRAYKALAETATAKELTNLSNSWKDQYGKFSPSVENLLLATSLKIAAADANISSIELQGQRLMLTRNGNYIMLEGKRFPRLSKTDPKEKLQQALQMLRGI